MKTLIRFEFEGSHNLVNSDGVTSSKSMLGLGRLIKSDVPDAEVYLADDFSNAIVETNTLKEAEKILERLDGHLLNGYPIKVEILKKSCAPKNSGHDKPEPSRRSSKSKDGTEHCLARARSGKNPVRESSESSDSHRVRYSENDINGKDFTTYEDISYKYSESYISARKGYAEYDFPMAYQSVKTVRKCLKRTRVAMNLEMKNKNRRCSKHKTSDRSPVSDLKRHKHSYSSRRSHNSLKRSRDTESIHGPKRAQELRTLSSFCQSPVGWPNIDHSRDSSELDILLSDYDLNHNLNRKTYRESDRSLERPCDYDREPTLRSSLDRKTPRFERELARSLESNHYRETDFQSLLDGYTARRRDLDSYSGDESNSKRRRERQSYRDREPSFQRLLDRYPARNRDEMDISRERQRDNDRKVCTRSPSVRYTARKRNLDYDSEADFTKSRQILIHYDRKPSSSHIEHDPNNNAEPQNVLKRKHGLDKVFTDIMHRESERNKNDELICDFERIFENEFGAKASVDSDGVHESDMQSKHPPSKNQCIEDSPDIAKKIRLAQQTSLPSTEDVVEAAITDVSVAQSPTAQTEPILNDVAGTSTMSTIGNSLHENIPAEIHQNQLIPKLKPVSLHNLQYPTQPYPQEHQDVVQWQSHLQMPPLDLNLQQIPLNALNPAILYQNIPLATKNQNNTTFTWHSVQNPKTSLPNPNKNPSKKPGPQSGYNWERSQSMKANFYLYNHKGRQYTLSKFVFGQRYEASAKIAKQMRNIPLIHYFNKPSERNLIQCLRSAIRARIETLIHGCRKPIHIHEIVQYYRLFHPISKDTDFAEQVMETFKRSENVDTFQPTEDEMAQFEETNTAGEFENDKNNLQAFILLEMKQIEKINRAIQLREEIQFCLEIGIRERIEDLFKDLENVNETKNFDVHLYSMYSKRYPRNNDEAFFTERVVMLNKCMENCPKIIEIQHDSDDDCQIIDDASENIVAKSAPSRVVQRKVKRNHTVRKSKTPCKTQADSDDDCQLISFIVAESPLAKGVESRITGEPFAKKNSANITAPPAKKQTKVKDDCQLIDDTLESIFAKSAPSNQVQMSLEKLLE